MDNNYCVERMQNVESLCEKGGGEEVEITFHCSDMEVSGLNGS